MSSANSKVIRELIKRRGGVLKLLPTYVPRFYRDFDRLGQKHRRTRNAPNIPERWIASSVEAINPPPLPKGGLSMLADLPAVSLRDAIRAAPQDMFGDDLLARHGPEFRVLVKILDPGEPIPFHLHATDEQVKRLPQHFRGHRFGKDEAYYFLDAPKGVLPYTHVGLHPGVTRRELLAAVKRGRDHALELSPVIYQKFEQGFFLPAGVPHSPGTALTLEIQQPSDVYTLLETTAGGKPMTAQQIHPGFASMDEAFQLIDMKLSERVGMLKEHQLSPIVISSSRDADVAWIFPAKVCGKFAGKRVRVNGAITLRERSAVAMLVWKGRGKVNGRAIRAGDEFFVTDVVMRAGVRIETDERVELFWFFPVMS
jgi:mannose-6-phosphate isomerase class I